MNSRETFYLSCGTFSLTGRLIRLAPSASPSCTSVHHITLASSALARPEGLSRAKGGPHDGNPRNNVRSLANDMDKLDIRRAAFCCLARRMSCDSLIVSLCRWWAWNSFAYCGATVRRQSDRKACKRTAWLLGWQFVHKGKAGTAWQTWQSRQGSKAGASVSDRL